MLYAKDRGCSRPGCDAPAYHSEVHHVTPWTTTHRTDINDLTLACGPDNRLVEKGWKTRKNAKPARTPKATLNGYRRPTWTMANHASIDTTTPRKSCANPTTTNHIDTQ